jgi:hypothetical protein
MMGGRLYLLPGQSVDDYLTKFQPSQVRENTYLQCFVTGFKGEKPTKKKVLYAEKPKYQQKTQKGSSLIILFLRFLKKNPQKSNHFWTICWNWPKTPIWWWGNGCCASQRQI